MKAEELRKDKRLVEAFASREDLLNRNINYIEDSELEILKSFEKRPGGQLTLTSWNNLIDKMQKMKRGNLSKSEIKKNEESEGTDENLFDKVINLLRRL